MEMTVKVIALGYAFCGGDSYIRSGWNQLDFVIVVVGIVSWAAENVNVGGIRALRAFRVLRPLKLISNIESLQIVLNSLLKAIPKLVNVAALLLFFMVIYAIIGLEFYRSFLSQMCYDVNTNAWNETWRTVEEDSVCSMYPDKGVQCGDEQVCLHNDYPRDEGMQSFNNVGTALLTVFICTTQEGWTNVLYVANDTTGSSNINWLYFVSLIILGSFLITNLMLGVISGQFTREGEKLQMQAAHRKAVEEAKFKDTIQDYTKWIDEGTIVSDTQSGDNGGDGKGKGNGNGKGNDNNDVSVARHASGPAGVKRFDSEVLDSVVKDHQFSMSLPQKSASSDDDEGANTVINNRSDEDFEGDNGAGLPLLLIRLPDGSRVPVSVNMTETVKNVKRRIQHCLTDSMHYMLQPDGVVAGDDMMINDLDIIVRLPDELDAINHMDHNNKRALLKQSSLSIHSWAGYVAKSQTFTILVMSLVFLNTLVLGMEHYPQKEIYSVIFFWCEVFFLTLFGLEATFKIYAFGWKMYWSSKFNKVCRNAHTHTRTPVAHLPLHTFYAPVTHSFVCSCIYIYTCLLCVHVHTCVYKCFYMHMFIVIVRQVDFIVTVLSIIEFSCVQGAGMPSMGISVLRCVRLMRVFRYTSYWEGMNDLANALVDSFSSIISLLLLLLIFMMIFALLGMQLFGGRFNFAYGTPRTNFNSFEDALLAMFQVLSGEDWNAVMKDGIVAYNGIESDGCVCVSQCASPYPTLCACLCVRM